MMTISDTKYLQKFILPVDFFLQAEDLKKDYVFAVLVYAPDQLDINKDLDLNFCIEMRSDAQRPYQLLIDRSVISSVDVSKLETHLKDFIEKEYMEYVFPSGKMEVKRGDILEKETI